MGMSSFFCCRNEIWHNILPITKRKNTGTNPYNWMIFNHFNCCLPYINSVEITVEIKNGSESIF